MIFMYTVEIDVDIKSWLKWPQGTTLQFLSNSLRKQTGHYCHKLSWLVTEMLWSLLSCLHEGKCASFLEHCFSLVGSCKARKARALEHNCVNDSQLHASVRCKVILNQKCAEPVLWFGCPRDVHNSTTALCKMSATCKMLLLGFTFWYCRPLFQEKIVPEG